MPKHAQKHTQGTDHTKDFVSTAEFGAMKKTGVFISIGRGLVVDEDALNTALQTGSIAGAAHEENTSPPSDHALDVFKKEPLTKESPLWNRENILITAHNADFTEDYFELGWNVWRENYECIKADKPVATPVEKAAGY